MKNRTSCYCILALLVCQGLVASFGVVYATPQDEAIREAEKIIRLQTDRQDAQGTSFSTRRTPATPLIDIKLPDTNTSDQSETCHFINQIIIYGISIFSDEEIAELTRPFVNRCLDLKEINEILRNITIAYFDAGYVTSRPYIRPQDLSDQILELNVVEGTIGQIYFKENLDEGASSLRFTFPNKPGDLLNIRDLEQGLDQLNRLQSNNVKLNIFPGKEPGTSDISLENSASNKFHLSLALDNYGSESTGEIQGHTSFGYDNPFGISDYFYTVFSHDLHLNSGKNSRNVFARYEVPYGWNLYGLTYSQFDYKQDIEGGIQDFSATGTTRNLSLSFNRIVFRNQKCKISFGAVLDRKDEENYLLDVLLDTSSQLFFVSRGSLKIDCLFERTTLSLSATSHHGLDIFDARDGGVSPPDAPEAQFSKVSTDLSLNTAFHVGTDMIFDLVIHGQYSEDPLFASEQLTIGSLYSVRGFKNDSFSGNKGGYVRNELLFPVSTGRFMRRLNIANIEPFLGFDWGWVNTQGASVAGDENLQSWTVGVKGWDAYQSVKVSYSRSIGAPGYFDENEGVFSFSLNRYF